MTKRLLLSVLDWKMWIKDSFIVIVDEELLEEISVTYSSMWSNLRGDKN